METKLHQALAKIHPRTIQVFFFLRKKIATSFSISFGLLMNLPLLVVLPIWLIPFHTFAIWWQNLILLSHSLSHKTLNFCLTHYSPPHPVKLPHFVNCHMPCCHFITCQRSTADCFIRLFHLPRQFLEESMLPNTSLLLSLILPLRGWNFLEIIKSTKLWKSNWMHQQVTNFQYLLTSLIPTLVMLLTWPFLGAWYPALTFCDRQVPLCFSIWLRFLLHQFPSSSMQLCFSPNISTQRSCSQSPM